MNIRDVTVLFKIRYAWANLGTLPRFVHIKVKGPVVSQFSKFSSATGTFGLKSFCIAIADNKQVLAKAG